MSHRLMAKVKEVNWNVQVLSLKPLASAQAVVLRYSAPWSSMTPLGLAVLPDVHIRNARSRGLTV